MTQLTLGDLAAHTEFLAHIVLPGGKTIGQQVLPRLDDYATHHENIAGLLPAPMKRTKTTA